MKQTLIIAEAGVNHNGDLARAMEMIAAAKEAGADYVKFQAVKHVGNLIAADAPVADYQRRNTGATSQLEMVGRLMLPMEQYATLARACRESGIGFAATPFDLPSISFLASLGIDFMKVPSGEITNKPYLREVARMGLPVIMSTGMSTLGETEAALEILISGGITTDRITLLHCNTEYPTPYADVNLRAMLTLLRAFGTSVGYSDHTLGIEVPVAAVALGAEVIEKHFTMSRELQGPDHAASLTPGELKAMVAAIRHTEQAMGDGRKSPSRSERRNINVARRSIVAARPISKGEKFTDENLAAKRPGGGISPMQWDEVVGRIAPRDFKPDEPITI